MPTTRDAVWLGVEAALQHLAADGLVALPTETVWGLAARATSPRAVERLRDFKGRGDEQPISLLIEGADVLEDYGFALGPLARAVVDAFWPGPLTLIVPGPERPPFAAGIAAATGAVGFRCSEHPLCASFVACAFERGLGPLTATSFNRTGETPVHTRSEAQRLIEQAQAEHVRCLEPGADDAFAAPPSTVLDLSGPAPRVLRWGAIGEAALRPFLDRFEGVGAQR